MACHARRLRALCATKSDGSLDIDAISALPFIVFEHIDESPHVIEHVLSFHPKRVIRLPSIPLIASYVEQGIGAAIVPDADLKLFHEHTKVYPMRQKRTMVGELLEFIRIKRASMKLLGMG